MKYIIRSLLTQRDRIYMKKYTSECVSSGHPDKVADQVSDAILDAYLEDDPDSMVACETLIKEGTIVLAGEITSLVPDGGIDIESIARRAVTDIGYNHEEIGFDGPNATVLNLLSGQSPQINAAVIGESIGAGDQGLMFGYATTRTDSFMPPAIHFARRLIDAYEIARKLNPDMYRPDAKSQITVDYYSGTVHTAILSFHHSTILRSVESVREAFDKDILPHFWKLLTKSERSGFRNADWRINTAGPWTIGGPAADAGVTGRKIVVDNYGSACPVGGGAFSGKDPSKVDRSGAYAARQLAKAICREGLADSVQVQIAYAIGEEHPVSVDTEVFSVPMGVHINKAGQLASLFAKDFDLRPGAIIERLDLKRPIYEETARTGHFGRGHYTWEK